jgi:hypothetical protein
VAYRVGIHSMPTPTFAFRLGAEERRSLVDTSKLSAAPNPRVFLREMVVEMCSGEPARVRAFAERVAKSAGEQLVLSLSSYEKHAAHAPHKKHASHAARVRRKRGRLHARTT